MHFSLGSKLRAKASFLCQNTLQNEKFEHVQALLLQIEQEYDFRAFSLQSFAQWVATKRRREMRCIGWRLPASISGVWLATEETDFVFYEIHTPVIHQIHIQLHELAHIICNHKTLALNLATGIGREEILQYLTGAFTTQHRQNQPIEQLLLRSVHDNQEEQEAELLSALIQQRITRDRFYVSLTQPITFSNNSLVLGVYQTMGWV